jgi:uncharacterized protein YoxC
VDEETLQILLSVAEVLVLVAVLAFFVIRLTQLLGHTSRTLDKIADGVRAIEGHVTPVGPGADEINRLLAETAGNLETATAAARRMT